MIRGITQTGATPVRLLVTALLFFPLVVTAQESVDSRLVPQVTVGPDVKNGRYMFNITLHTPEEIEGMLNRAEMLSQTTRNLKLSAGIALVLHGPEIEIFARTNYKKYRNIVDKAAKLDGDGVIEIKICKTQMDNMNIKEDDLPAFIEVVPYGPDEEKRLKREGYIDL
ncbi:MAG: hypothetical protein BMS9Abin33_0196 [Gammaproteobacteria bacterium]|nr:MAG: hypothetical protein BMS9Abin33_0196 [Gammaproteobacteria bacterium]